MVPIPCCLILCTRWWRHTPPYRTLCTFLHTYSLPPWAGAFVLAPTTHAASYGMGNSFLPSIPFPGGGGTGWKTGSSLCSYLILSPSYHSWIPSPFIHIIFLHNVEGEDSDLKHPHAHTCIPHSFPSFIPSSPMVWCGHSIHLCLAHYSPSSHPSLTLHLFTCLILQTVERRRRRREGERLGHSMHFN